MCLCSPTNVLAAYCGKTSKDADGHPVVCVHPETAKAHPAPPPQASRLHDHPKMMAAHFGAHPSEVHASAQHAVHLVARQCGTTAELARRQAALDYSRGHAAAASHMLEVAARSDAAAEHLRAGRHDDARAHIESAAHLLANQPERPGGLSPTRTHARPGEPV